MPNPSSTVSRTSHICLMAAYNEWMNRKLYEAASKLSYEELIADRKAFFGSILGTLGSATTHPMTPAIEAARRRNSRHLLPYALDERSDTGA